MDTFPRRLSSRTGCGRWHAVLALGCAVGLAACGGGGNDDSGTHEPSSSPDAATPAPPASAPVPSPDALPTLAQAIPLDGAQEGADHWPDNDTAQGGQGDPVDGIGCGLMSQDYHVHAHLGIYVDGQQLAVPQMGIRHATATLNQCTYALHTHDRSGKLHVEGPLPAQRYTLGEWFDIWGEPFSQTQVAEFADKPIVIYINDGGNLSRYSGDPRDIELIDHREITVQIGTPLTELATYIWPAETSGSE